MARAAKSNPERVTLPLHHYARYKLPERLTDHTDNQTCRAKPKGLWLSDESAYGWKQWCEDNEYGEGQRRVEHCVTLKPEARIRVITSPEELKAFGYEFRSTELGRFLPTMKLDWLAVARQYQGILITPYQWSLRYSDDAQWYHTWDCASGCVWDPDAILEIETLILEDES